jgi:hypothetical protein
MKWTKASLRREEAGLFSELSGDLHIHTGVAELAEAIAGDKRVGILHGGSDLADTSGDERIGTGRGTAVMRAGLQSCVEDRAAGAVTSRTRTAPTAGLGLVWPTARAASSRASRR